MENWPYTDNNPQTKVNAYKARVLGKFFTATKYTVTVAALCKDLGGDLATVDRVHDKTKKRTYPTLTDCTLDAPNDDDKVIIGVGLYIRRKGIVDFVELAKRLPEYKFIWFGYSPLSAATRDVRKAVKTKLPNLQFPGYVEQKDIIGGMNGCDVYVFPTFEETEGIPIIEACACKANAIVRDIPIFEEWLEDGKNVYKAKDVNEFEEKIKKIINKELPPLGEKAYEVAKMRDIKKVGEQLKEVYEKVLSDCK